MELDLDEPVAFYRSPARLPPRHVSCRQQVRPMDAASRRGAAHAGVRGAPAGLPQALSCSAGAGNWFGAAGWRAGSTGYRRADVVMPHHLGMGRHLFLDVAVTDPGVGAALTARPSPSSSSSGVAAELRAQKKVQKYEGLAAAMDSSF